MNRDTLIRVYNKDNGPVGYTIPELNVRRQFPIGGHKDIPFHELEQLSFIPGGRRMIEKYLTVDLEVLKELGFEKIEPEYYYTDAEILDLMQTKSLDEFLDCLDFAPKAILNKIKEYSVTLPLNDIAKRDAIYKKLGFDVTAAIENEKVEEEVPVQEEPAIQRRASQTAVPAGRRTEAPKYKVVSKIE